MPKRNNNNLFELIAKLRTMATRGGTPAERAIASIKLQELSVKYNINLDEYFIPVPKKKRVIKVADWSDSKNIMVHCILDTVPSAHIEGNDYGKKLIVSLSDKEYNEVIAKFAHYHESFLKEKDALLQAFILKNNLGVENCEASDEEKDGDIDAILKYISIIENNQLNKNKMLW
ncbi:MAG: hypothetical protein A3F72_02725 [Bacteroidetes bacterium RIFCSPLOWO2_12_FULL_35_15]|nr:MAG: hypothetical protein A3F72_02725 [Bacteroidetes bacterium RIFCSPLOWO2_12_FULL_35_15]